jgi:hypothetical protein
MSTNILVIVFQNLEKVLSRNPSAASVVVQPVPGSPALLGFPSDTLLPGEAPEQAAQRVVETLGLKVRKDRLYGVDTVEKDGVRTIAFTVNVRSLPEHLTSRSLPEVDVQAGQTPKAFLEGFTVWLSLAADTILG